MEPVVQKYLQEAKHCVFNQNYGKAYAFYLLVLKLCPHLQNVVENDFGAVWREWSSKLRDLGRIDDLFTLYEQGCDAFMRCEMLHFHMGNALFHLNYKLEAIGMYRKALCLNEHCSEASISLENACRGVVDSWHFSMLNDEKRNLAFEKAINAVIQDDDIVLDIGSGTGILSMLAIKHGAKSVYACEMSEALHSIAQECVQTNDYSSSIKLLNSHSTKLTVDGFSSHPTSIPEKCSVVITETVDAGLLGEGIIDTLSHAWKMLLKPSHNGGKVIPGSAVVYCCFVECEDIHKKHIATRKHSFPAVCITSGVGFKTNKSKSTENGINCSSVVNTCELEPYTSETLSNLSFKVLTKPQELTRVDFNDVKMVENYANETLPDIATQHTALESGFVDAVVLWFDLELEPNSNSTMINTGIGTEHCWDQAIYPIRDFNVALAKHECIVNNRVQVQKSDVLTSVFQVHCDCFYLDCVEIKRTFNDSIQVFHQSLQDQSFPHITVAEEQIKRVNDPVYSNMCFRNLCDLKNSNESFTVLDISNGFDLFALKTALAAKVCLHKYCQTKDIHDALNKLAEHCKINVNFHRNLPPIDGLKFDAIVSHVIEPSGLISPNAISNICKAKSSLSQSGFIFPNRISLVVQCIESEPLLSKCMVLSNEKTMGLKIADTINDFRVSTHSDLDINSLNHTAISNPETILCFDFNEASAETLLRMTKSIVIKAISPGTLHAILFWFKINVCGDDMLETRAVNNHWKQAAYVFPRKKQIKMKKDDEIVLKAITNDDSILFQASTYGA